ncbi:helix-turn-helix domain-containing protein [Actinomadura scrupuli]|uniref:helix-turn-helix domain-containing protein n=1 Tax=Actinomadura scrupuli TaxID=559629 RepID=UPI003D999235
MAPRRTPTVRQRRLGAELRRLRDGKRMTADEVADRLRWSPSKISRLENAKIGARISDVRLLLEVYRVDESHLGEVLALAQVANERGWWADYQSDLREDYTRLIAYEDEADSAFHFQALVVPGLLQTEEYARHVITGGKILGALPPQRIDRLVDVRMRRQLLLVRPQPLKLSIVLDEAVLLRRVGDQATMRRQLARLCEVSRLPNLDIRVLPLGVPHGLFMGGSFDLLVYSPAYDVTFPDIVNIENYMSIISQDESVAYAYRLTFEHQKAQALGPEESRARILQIVQDRWQD